MDDVLATAKLQEDVHKIHSLMIFQEMLHMSNSSFSIGNAALYAKLISQ